MRVLGRRVYWRWYGEVLLSGGLVLRMTGDAAKWLRPGDRVQLSTEKPVLGFDEYALWGRFPLWPPFAEDLEHAQEGSLGGEAYRCRLRAREAQFEADFEAIAELEQFHYASEKEVVALWVCPRCGKTLAASSKPLCDCGGEARLKEIKGSTFHAPIVEWRPWRALKRLRAQKRSGPGRFWKPWKRPTPKPVPSSSTKTPSSSFWPRSSPPRPPIKA